MSGSTVKIREENRVKTTVSAEVSKISSSAFVLSATAVGCWAIAALFAGATSSGGPFELLRALVTTITG